jgi:hypothetical protein
MLSLFTAATKRAPLDAERRDSAEDRLTEIFAAVLERAPAAACTLVNSWVEKPKRVGHEYQTKITPAIDIAKPESASRSGVAVRGPSVSGPDHRVGRDQAPRRPERR